MGNRKPLILITGVLLALMIIMPLFISACSEKTETATVTSSITTTATTIATTTVKPIELKIVCECPATHMIYALMEKWSKKVEEQTNGKVHFTLYPSGTLCNPPEIYDAVIGGIADIAIGPPGYAPARFGLNSFIGDALHRLPSSEVGSKVYNEIWQNSPELQAEFDGMKLLWLAVHGPGDLLLKSPAYTLDDLQGREIRYPGSMTPFGKALGVVPVSMPMTEAYVALEKGIVEGVTSPTSELKGNRFAEVVGYTMVLNYYAGSRCTLMNINTWESLPEDVKAVIDGLNAWGSAEEARGWDSYDIQGIEFAEPFGHELITPTEEVMRQVYERLYECNETESSRLEADGKPAKAVLKVLNQVEEKYFGPWK